MTDTKRIRPLGQGTDSKHYPGEGSATPSIASIPPKNPYDPHSDPRPADSFFRNSYAVLVRGKAVRRHLYFNLPAAQRAVQRAEKSGYRAEMILVKLVPVDARHLDQEEVACIEPDSL